jgi:putative ABC transport system permease protein
MNDLRFAIRQLRKNPGFTAVAVITLALGIGANTAIFSVVKEVLLRPLPYPEPERLVMLWERSPRRDVEEERVTGLSFFEWREESRVFEDLALWPSWGGTGEFNLAGPDGPEKVRGIYALSSLFGILRVNPLLGRTFLSEEDQREGNPVAVIGHDLWLRRFAADPEILGRTLTVDSYGRRDYTVVGVMPPGFRFPYESELWLPAGWMGVALDRRPAHWYQVIGRLKAGVTLEEARAEMNAIQARLEGQNRQALLGSEVAVVPLLDHFLGKRLRPALLVLWGAVGCVLLIACANVANLLLARGAARQREISLRRALGASGWRVARQLLAESLFLSLIGGALGLLLSVWGLHLLVVLGSEQIPRLGSVKLDGGSLAFTLLVSLLIGLLFGSAPAWQLSRSEVNDALKDSGRGAAGGPRQRRLRGLLVASEIALSLVLLISAGLMARSFARLVRIDRGFREEHLLTAQLDFSVSGFTTWVQPTPTRPQVKLKELMDRIRTLPGIQSVAAASKLPRDIGSSRTQTIILEGRPPPLPGEEPTADYQAVSPDYFPALGVPLLRGRAFTEGDLYEARSVAIVNETMARTWFPGEDPLGKRLAMEGRTRGRPAEPNPNQTSPWSEVVGVVRDVKSLDLKAEAVPVIYVPYWQYPMQSPVLLARTAGDPGRLAAAIRGEVRAVAASLPAPKIRTMREILADSVAEPRFHAVLSSLFGIAALLLAAIGIYGVISYSVAQRTTEIGIRMALGARAGDVLRLVVGIGMRPAFLGLALGLAGALSLTRVLRSLLYGVHVLDPLTFVATTVLLALVALLASWIPARRATRVDPMAALRIE